MSRYDNTSSAQPGSSAQPNELASSSKGEASCFPGECDSLRFAERPTALAKRQYYLFGGPLAKVLGISSRYPYAVAAVTIIPSPEALATMTRSVLERLGAGELADPQSRVGRQAARDGLSLADCPYAPGDSAGKGWRAGWIDEMAKARLP